MTIPTNYERADWARNAVEAFRDGCHGSMNADGSPDIEEAVGDLIGDLLHLCEQEGLDPFERLKQGISHYVVEKLDPPDGMAHEASVTIDVHAKRYGQPNEPWQHFEYRRDPLLQNPTTEKETQ